MFRTTKKNNHTSRSRSRSRSRSASRKRASKSRSRSRSASRKRASSSSRSLTDVYTYQVLFNDKSYEKDISQFGFEIRENDVDISEIDNKLCSTIHNNTPIFDLSSVADSINNSTFSLLIKKSEKIKAVISITVYKTRIETLWEMTYVCGTPSEKGLGKILLDKMIHIAKLYEKPITIYGVGIPAGARKVYMSKGFKPHFNENGLQLVIE